ncbi:MAG TPA: FAD-dependent monooxygenase [Bryobacteraceae bacterium]|jgi:salicylate hydroxylase
MERPRIPCLIAGGGIGGLAAALSISRAGIPTHVLEKSGEFSEIGAGLQLAPNATRMLDRLGILDVICKQAIFPERLVMMDALSGRPITSLDLGPKFRSHFGYPYILMHRGDLLAAELAACQANPLVTLEKGKEVVSVEDAADHAIVRCTDGSVYVCDALIGADGLWSTVRKVVHDDGPPVCARFVAYRGTVPIGEAPPGADLRNMTIWVGPDMHFVQYVVKSGHLFNQVAVFRSHRYREDSDDWGTPEELDSHYANFCGPVRTAVTAIRRDRRWPMFDRLPIPNWTRGRITLLGDAAHPMLQYIAQGACQALEDAVRLGECFSQFRGDVVRAFAAYQASRIPRTARVQQIARFFGDVKHISGAGIALRNALLARRAPDDFEYFEWLYGFGRSVLP